MYVTLEKKSEVVGRPHGLSKLGVLRFHDFLTELRLLTPPKELLKEMLK